MNKRIAIAIFIIGASSIAAQIVLIREMLVVFYGSELSLGFIVGSWLLGGGIGSLSARKFTSKIDSRVVYVSGLQLVSAIIFLLTLTSIRSARIFLGLITGETPAFSTMSVSSLALLVPISALFGFIFVVACAAFKEAGAARGYTVSVMYIMDAAGAAAGGCIASFLLVRYFDPVSIGGILLCANSICSLCVILKTQATRARPVISWLASVALIFALLLFAVGGFAKINDRLVKMQWHGHDIVACVNSIYANIVVTENRGLYSFFYNGEHLYSVPDKASAEDEVNFAMLEHPNPHKVLVIGGGPSVIEEALKGSPEEIDYVEMDPELVSIMKQCLPPCFTACMSNPAVKIISADALFYIKNTTMSYDVILMNSGYPNTAQVNRYYTNGFFDDVKRILRSGGIFSFISISQESFMPAELRTYLGMLHRTLKASFADVKVIPGNMSVFLASVNPGLLTYDYRVLLQRSLDRGLKADFVNQYYLPARMSRDKIAFTEDAIMEAPGRVLNTDLDPILYYYATIYQASYFRDSPIGAVLKYVMRAQRQKLPVTAAILLLFFVAALTIRSFGKKIGRRLVLLSIAVAGFSSMAAQMLILFSFQTIYGYIYYKLGVIIAVFMAGLSAGAFIAIRYLSKLRVRSKLFAVNQTFLALSILLLPAAFIYFLGCRSGIAATSGPNVIFSILAALPAVLTGIQFSMANSILSEEGMATANLAGATYGFDLFGAFLGALMTLSVLIPLLGITGTCVLIAGINFIMTGILTIKI